MEDQILIMRLKELRAQLAELTRRLEGLDDLLSNGITDEAVQKYAEELKKIIDEREPILREARSLLMLVDKKAPDIGDGGAMVN